MPARISSISRTVTSAAGLLLIALALIGCSRPIDGSTLLLGTAAPLEPQLSSIDTTLVRVIDGETLVVEPVDGILEPNNGEKNEHVVRLLGIAAPDTGDDTEEPAECGSRSSAAHLSGIVQYEDEITISFDPRVPEATDDGISQAYVTDETGDDLGHRQIFDGYAVPERPDGGQIERMSRYEAAFDEAADTFRGAHAWCTDLGSS